MAAGYTLGMASRTVGQEWQLDPHHASVARVYNYLMGGKDNYAVDREMGDKLRESSPDIDATVRVNRAFGARATRYLARLGITQFIDLGCGIPTTPPCIHEVARQEQPDARVVYVDHDPIVVSYSRALRDRDDGLVSVHADLAEPELLLDDPAITAVIDFDRPVALLFISVLQTLPDTGHVTTLMRSYIDRMAPGSHLAISHVSADSDDEAIDGVRGASAATGYPLARFRDDAEILGFFHDLDLVEPGLVDISRWRPDPDPVAPTSVLLRGAVGAKR